MTRTVLVCLSLLCAAQPIIGTALRGQMMLQTSAMAAANPIRKVVTILQDMAKEVEEEGRREEDLMDKFNCYCEKNQKQMTLVGGGKERGGEDISTAESKIEELTARVQQETAEKASLAQELKGHKADRTQANEDLSKATAIREKEKEAWQAANAEGLSNIDKMGKAIVALEKGMTEPALLQTGSVAGASVRAALQVIRGVLDSDSVAAAQFMGSGAATSGRLTDDFDRRSVQTFLETAVEADGQLSSAVPQQSGQIVGILKQMKEDMAKDTKEAADEEAAKEASFTELRAAKQKEIKANTDAVESKTVRAGEVAVALVNSQNDLEDTSGSLEETRVMLKDLQGSCKTKNQEWEERKETRAQEAMAISETIKILNDDDSLEVFNKTLPKPAEQQEQGLSLVQLRTSFDGRARAQRILNSLPVSSASQSATQRARLVLLQNQVKSASGKADFSKIMSMIDEMVEVLHKEQKNDADQLAWCNTEFDESQDNLKEKHRALDSVTATLEEGAAEIEAIAEEIATASQEIRRLDESVAEATEQRKAEHAEYIQTQTDLTAAQQLLAEAKNRLNKFYNPAQYQPTPEAELTEQQRIEQNMGLEVETPPPEMIAGTQQTVSFVQVRVHTQASARQAPETFDAPYEKSEKSGGVTALIDMLVKDLAKDQQQGQNDEKVSQRDYDMLLSQSKASREQLTQSVTDKEAAKAELQTKMQDAKAHKEGTEKAIEELGQYLSELHASCDFLLKNFDIRKEARTSEIEGLKQAKAVLAGADYA